MLHKSSRTVASRICQTSFLFQRLIEVQTKLFFIVYPK